MTRPGYSLAIVVLIAAMALPFVVPVYYVQFAAKICIMATLSMALNLVVGHGGMVSLCHAAFFGLGGYVLALLSPGYDAASLLLTFPVAMCAAALAALAIGALSLRTRGIYFIMVTLAFGEMLFYFFHDTKFAGGSDGKFVNEKPELVIGGLRLLDLNKPMTFYFVVLVWLAIVFAICAMIVRSPFGHALAAARDNERRARALGFPIYRIRLVAFTISGAMAGSAGYFAAAQFGFVAPQMLGWHVSAMILVMVLVGGLRSVPGPVVGAAALIMLEEVLKSSTEYWKLAQGLVIIVIVLALPGGLRQLWPMIVGERKPRLEDAKARMSEIALRAEALHKRFGGLRAVADVSLDVHVGEIHAVIGPNGAGKSTLVNLLSGELFPDSGRILLNGVDVTRGRPDRRARAGLARAFQKTTIFAQSTVHENVRLAAQAHARAPLRMFGTASADADINARTDAGLLACDLGSRRDRVAATLSHGEQRQLEIAMVIATDPRVVLLDEPLAGMGQAEAQRIIALIASLKAQRAVLIVEHDMDAVFALADRLTVMQDGRVIATGAPHEVRMHPAVRSAYLGDHP